jgi:phosphate transport system substrate-binding protein
VTLWLAAVAGALVLLWASSSAAVATGPTVSGAGSTWVQIALDQWRADIARQGFGINYQGVGSSAGRSLYITGGVDFAASEIPFQPDELNQLRGNGKHYQYMPDVAGGTSLMYNLHTPAGGRVTSLRLDADAAAKIFTGVINRWQDPEIVALNPGLQVRETRIIPVIRSDGSGTSAQFSLYLADQASGVWNSFVSRLGVDGCPAPCSQWPPFTGSQNAAYSDGVANTIANDALGSGAIGYVEAGYAFGRGFPVASLYNVSGNYTQPTSNNVATALTHATLYSDLTQNLTGVYRAPEANAYAMSSYSYMILPCQAPATAFPTCSPDAPVNFGADKGFVLGTWIIYIACAGQRRAAPLGYSPLPPNLVQADLDAVNRLPGHPQTPPLDYEHCPNPTLYTGASNSSGGSQPASTGGSQPASTGVSQPSSTGSAQPSAPGRDLGSAVTGDTSVDPSALESSTVLPAGVARVTVLDSAARTRMLDSALDSAARTQGPSRAPLWGSLAILLLAVFTPMLVVTARGRARGG